MLGSIVGAGMKAVGGILGGMSARKAMKRMRESLERQQAENQSWYDRKYNEDATQRADAQRLLAMTEENIRKRNKAAAGANAVMGGSAAADAATAEANAQEMADAASNINLQGEQRKDAVEQQYMNKKDALQSQLDGLQMKKAQATAQAIQGVTDAAGDIASML